MTPPFRPQGKLVCRTPFPVMDYEVAYDVRHLREGERRFLYCARLATVRRECEKYPDRTFRFGWSIKPRNLVWLTRGLDRPRPSPLTKEGA